MGELVGERQCHHPKLRQNRHLGVPLPDLMLAMVACELLVAPRPARYANLFPQTAFGLPLVVFSFLSRSD
jgi:hypothetical protein